MVLTRVLTPSPRAGRASRSPRRVREAAVSSESSVPRSGDL